MRTGAQIRMKQGRAVGVLEGKEDTFLRLALPKFGELSAEQTEQVRST